MRRQIITTFLLFGTLAQAAEYIENFTSNITLDSSTWVTVRETIDFYANNQKINHGILRVLPITYAGHEQRYYKILSVRLDGQPTFYFAEQHTGKLSLYIGDKNKLLNRGFHRAELIYKTVNQIGFFKQADEFAWNVTGDWPFKIKAATATLTLPKNIPPNAIMLEAYSGFYGEHGHYYTAHIDQETCVFTTTQALEPHQNITVVASWPSGYIAQPTAWQHIIFYVTFFPSTLVCLITLLLLMALFVFCKRLQKSKHQSVIIPRFVPPQQLLPGTMRYILGRSYDQKAFTADLVNMAVQGFITIDPIKKSFGKEFALNKTEHTATNPSYRESLQQLFANDKTVVMIKENRSAILGAQQILQNHARQEKDALFRSVTGYHAIMFIGWALCFALTMITTFVFDSWISEGLGLYAIGYSAVLIIPCMLLRTYTPAGLQLVDEINGFKLFLRATEQERLAMLSAPERSPQQYERFLPYAIALGVEKQWTRQFKSVLERLSETERQHIFMWYHGYWSPALFASLGSDLSTNLSYGFMQSSAAPGSRSSSGGSGFSGSGGGGGGGGGW